MKSNTLNILALANTDIPGVLPNAVLLLETPDLSGSPAITNALDVRVDSITVGSLGQPLALEESLVLVGVAELSDGDP